MKTNLSGESNLKRQELISIIREIVYLSDPEKILLISASFEYLITESIYYKNAVQELTGKHYNLLVLSTVKEKKSLLENEIALNSRFKDRRNLQFQVMDIFRFNEDVKSGNEQANYILANAMLWYDKERVPLVFPNGESN